MESKIYLKVIGRNWENRDMKYVRGLNVIDNFEENGSCVPGRMYFCDPTNPTQNICRYLHMGDLLVDVTLPTNDPEFKMMIDPSGGKTCANKIIIGKERKLSDPETFEYMDSHGVDIKKNFTLNWACDKKYWDVVLYLLFATPVTESRFNIVNKVLTNERCIPENIKTTISKIINEDIEKIRSNKPTNNLSSHNPFKKSDVKIDYRTFMRQRITKYKEKNYDLSMMGYMTLAATEWKSFKEKHGCVTCDY
ncbi:repeat protein [Moumouvirus goulette]|uniref:Repeat protein n=1 Tax=Moumouvirus goulette TaxID=1247379 RepID=M1PFW3_9VIRU|nr:repeat protein [Moumouvirus goulette]AGF84883.1 repeat protein [Moumouvirus goulette]